MLEGSLKVLVGSAAGTRARGRRRRAALEDRSDPRGCAGLPPRTGGCCTARCRAPGDARCGRVRACRRRGRCARSRAVRRPNRRPPEVRHSRAPGPLLSAGLPSLAALGRRLGCRTTLTRWPCDRARRSHTGPSPCSTVPMPALTAQRRRLCASIVACECRTRRLARARAAQRKTPATLPSRASDVTLARCPIVATGDGCRLRHWLP